MKIRFLPVILIVMSLTSHVLSKSVKTENVRNRIAVLVNSNSGTTGIAGAVAGALRREGFRVTCLTPEKVCGPDVLSAQKYFLYVIPHGQVYPENGETALKSYIEQKGNLLILGRPDLPGQPLLETVSPKYKMYKMNDIDSLAIVEHQAVLPRTMDMPVPASAASCFRRPTGKGFERGYSFRWIPLITAHDENGLERGTAAWMLINQAPIKQSPVFKDALRRLVATTEGNVAEEQLNVEGSVFGVCAITDPTVLQKLADTPLFGNMAKRISQGVYLSHAGAQEFSYWPGESMQLGAAVVNYGAISAAVDVKITVTARSNNRVVLQKEKKMTVKPGVTVKKPLGELVTLSESGGYEVQTILVSNGKTIDLIRYNVGMLSVEKEPEDAFVTVRGRNFWLNGKKWYPVGVNYWPRSAIATEQVDYLYHWLTPGYYDPDQIDNDLRLLKSMKGNFIAIRAHYDINRRTLLDFMRRCRKYDIYVYLSLQRHKVTIEPHYFEVITMPFMFEKALVEDFIKETRIVNNPALMAWDLIWEPSNWVFQDNVTMFGWDGNPNYRQLWDEAWAAWITERYGSLENAQADWGMSVPRRTDGHITSPSDKQFSKDGPWRVMVAAYRRFMSDLMDRLYNQTCRTMRELDPNHLLSYRQGNLPPTDHTLTSTLKHVDFFSMEAYSFPPKENGVNKVGFVNRYLAFALPDKPFMWNEYGYGGPWGKHTRHLDGEDVVYQYRYVDMVNREAYKNGANGIAPWWFAGGLRASEKTDFGITTPEGTLRPSGESVKRYGELYAVQAPTRPQPDTWLMIDADAHSGGLWYLTNNNGADAYEKAAAQDRVLGIRTLGTGTNSANTPLLAVGNTLYNGKNPPKYLNAEFNWLKIKSGDGEWTGVPDGSHIQVPAKTKILVRASVGNLQEATWLSPESSGAQFGAVYLASTGKSECKTAHAIDGNTPRYHDAVFDSGFLLTEGITEETAIQLQMTAKGRAWFGEKFDFVLVPVEK